MAVRYSVVFASSGSLAAGGTFIATGPVLEGQRVEHYGQAWSVAAIDDHQHPPVLTLRRLEQRFLAHDAFPPSHPGRAADPRLPSPSRGR